MKPTRATRNSRHGALITEAVAAMAMLTLAVLPLAFSFYHERTLLKAAYYRAVAMEIVDGELEILAAGEWRAYPPGTHAYAVRAGAATNLPAGEFELTRSADRVRLEWRPSEKHCGGAILREACIK